MGLTTTVNSGTRLARLGARLAGVATARTSRIAGQILLVVGLVFVLLRLHSLWHDAHIGLGAIRWLPFLASGAIAILAVVATAWIWLLVVRRLGARPRPRWVGIFLEAQLAKYIPGSVWHYAGRAALVGGEGLPLRVTTFSVSIELGASVIAALVVGGLTVGIWGLVCTAVIAGVLLLVASQVPVPKALKARTCDVPNSVVGTVALVAGLYVFVTLALGAAFWLTARALLPARPGQLGFYAGAFALAWVIGLVAVFAPVGLGVREAILVALLRNKIGTADALMVAVAFRGLLTIVDVGAAAAGAIVLRLGDASCRPEPAPVLRRGTAD